MKGQSAAYFARLIKQAGVNEFLRDLYINASILYGVFIRPRLYFCQLNFYQFQFCSRRRRNGHPLYRIDDRLRCRQHSAHLFLRKPAEAEMSWIYILSGVVTLAILVYLVIALLYPEKF
jgi:K+-transporting ATPase KdpF subunit